MTKLTQTGVGTVDNTGAIRDTDGTALLPIQVDGDGATTYRINARVSPDAPWVEVKAPSTADFIECLSWCPYIQLEVTAGSGTVTLWLGNK